MDLAQYLMSQSCGAAKQARIELLVAMRVVALDEICTSVRDMDVFPIREIDLVTVLVEMNGISEDDIFQAFCTDKRMLAKSIYSFLRKSIVNDNPPYELFKPLTRYDPEHDSASLRDKAKQYLNGMFFSMPAFFEQILALATSSGLFASQAMPREDKNAISVAMIIAFIFTGFINAAIGRTGAFFMFQWSSLCKRGGC